MTLTPDWWIAHPIDAIIERQIKRPVPCWIDIHAEFLPNTINLRRSGGGLDQIISFPNLGEWVLGLFYAPTETYFAYPTDMDFPSWADTHYNIWQGHRFNVSSDLAGVKKHYPELYRRWIAVLYYRMNQRRTVYDDSKIG